jgi:uncharacterized protein
VLITWDDRKNEDNFKKHDVWFEEAATVFSDPLAKTAPDTHPDEDRLITIGTSEGQRLLLVVHFERHEDEIRIISARPLTKRERKDYEEGI